MNFLKYVEWFKSVFGLEATNFILDAKNECIRLDGKSLNQFFKDYKRVQPLEGIEKGYIIKGCNKCIDEGLNVRNQDTPGFLGRINENEYIVIGLEPRISTDIHIAFDQFETNSEHRLFKNLKLLFSQIKEKAYITDIAKCMSTNYLESKKICMKTHFISELEILLEINPAFKIILQGTRVESYFNNKLTPFSNVGDDEIKAKNGKNLLFRRQYLTLNKKIVPTIVLPHSSRQTLFLWNQIKEPEILSKIKIKLEEFGF